MWSCRSDEPAAPPPLNRRLVLLRGPQHAIRRPSSSQSLCGFRRVARNQGLEESLTLAAHRSWRQHTKAPIDGKTTNLRRRRFSPVDGGGVFHSAKSGTLKPRAEGQSVNARSLFELAFTTPSFFENFSQDGTRARYDLIAESRNKNDRQVILGAIRLQTYETITLPARHSPTRSELHERVDNAKSTCINLKFLPAADGADCRAPGRRRGVPDR